MFKNSDTSSHGKYQYYNQVISMEAPYGSCQTTAEPYSVCQTMGIQQLQAEICGCHSIFSADTKSNSGRFDRRLVNQKSFGIPCKFIT